MTEKVTSANSVPMIRMDLAATGFGDGMELALFVPHNKSKSKRVSPSEVRRAGMKSGKSRGSLKALVLVLICCVVTLKAYSWYRWERARRLSIIYSSDLLAEFDPCDCTEGKLGGLARRASFVAGVRKEGVPTLLLDAGGIFFQSTDLPEHMRRQLSLKADSIARAYDQMGYDVVNVGDTDLALGLGRLLQLGEGSDFSVLSSNLAPSKEEGGVLPPYMIRKVGRLDVGVFGLVGGEGLADSLAARDPVETARKLVKRLRGEVDVLIALTYQGLSKDIELAREVEGIDIIIGGRTGASLAEPRIEKGTIILQTGLKGGFIGRLDLVLYNDKEPWEDATESEKYRRLALEYAEVVAKNDAILRSS
ncbi:MAG: hypothetical protein O7H41_10795, partial [Planctomycetota bacterium]|nr:hypothetical protein [Planctomycetota bacterium]